MEPLLFHSEIGNMQCGYCGGYFQRVLYDSNGNPQDVDWDSLIPVYQNHIASCTQQNPYHDDPNIFYGDNEACYIAGSGACPYGENRTM